MKVFITTTSISQLEKHICSFSKTARPAAASLSSALFCKHALCPNSFQFLTQGFSLSLTIFSMFLLEVSFISIRIDKKMAQGLINVNKLISSTHILQNTSCFQIKNSTIYNQLCRSSRRSSNHYNVSYP